LPRNTDIVNETGQDKKKANMTDEHFNSILTINSGSSSVKLGLYHVGPSEMLVLSGKIDRIGLAGSHFEMKEAGGKVLTKRELSLPDHETALKVFLDWLHDHIRRQGLDAVGHRVVHGGVEYVYPHMITLDLLASLKKLIPLAPGHLPQELRIIEAVRQWYPALRQVACFDTAFHRQMPEVAQMYALPRDLRDKSVIRYGFHGLSCEYLIEELRRQAGPEAADGSPGQRGEYDRCATWQERGYDNGIYARGGPGNEHAFGGLGSGSPGVSA
jgi:acetate kinase